MYDMCKALDKEDQMKKYRQYLPEGTDFKDASESEKSWDASSNSDGEEFWI